MLHQQIAVVLVHPAQVVQKLELGVPFLRVRHSVLQILSHKPGEVRVEQVAQFEILEICVFDVANSLLLQCAVLLGRLFVVHVEVVPLFSV